MAENKKEETKKEGKEVPLKWHISDTIITRYASRIVVQIVENVFKLSFFEVNPEIRIGPDAQLPSEVQAECVASIIVSPDKLLEFIEVMQRQFNKLKVREKSE